MGFPFPLGSLKRDTETSNCLTATCPRLTTCYGMWRFVSGVRLVGERIKAPSLSFTSVMNAIGLGWDVADALMFLFLVAVRVTTEAGYCGWKSYRLGL